MNKIYLATKSAVDTAQNTANNANTAATTAQSTADSKMNKVNPVGLGHMVIGDNNIIYPRSIIFGENCTAGHSYSPYAYAFGQFCTTQGTQSLAVGKNCKINYYSNDSYYAVAIGISSEASPLSTAIGEGVVSKFGQIAIGAYNVKNSDGTFLVGGGSNDSARANLFRVTGGNVYGGTYHSTGADYAEFFEWADGNTNKEDRIGLFVTLNGDKIEIAHSDDEFILGVVSGNPSILGDAHDDQWNQMYKTDIYGRDIFETITLPEEKDKDGVVYAKERQIEQRILNPDYDNTQKYIGRSQRKEWDPVGLLGKLVMIDDGTAEINGWVKPTKGGIATKSDHQTKFRVMSRLDENHIKILILS